MSEQENGWEYAYLVVEYTICLLIYVNFSGK